MILPSPVALLFSLALGMSASAAPVVFDSHHLLPRTVWSPRIITPTGKTVWKLNSEATVTWYVENARPLRLDIDGGGAWGFIVELDFSCVCVFVWNRDPSNPPPLAANNTGMVLLGHLNEDGSGGENLDVGQWREPKHVSYVRF